MFKSTVLVVCTLAGCQKAEPLAPPGKPVEPMELPAKVPEGATEPSDLVNAEQASLENALSAQPLDAGWSGRQEGRFTSAFANIGGGMTLESVECRSSLCRLTINQGSEDETNPAQSISKLATRAMTEDGRTSWSTAQYWNQGRALPAAQAK